MVRVSLYCVTGTLFYVIRQPSNLIILIVRPMNIIKFVAKASLYHFHMDPCQPGLASLSPALDMVTLGVEQTGVIPSSGFYALESKQ